MKAIGFREVSNGGSRYKFRHPDVPGHTISLHKPHNRNPPTIAVVYIKNVIAKLTEWGYI